MPNLTKGGRMFLTMSELENSLPEQQENITPPPGASFFVELKGKWLKIILATVLGFGLLAVSVYAGYWYGTETAKLPPGADQPLADKTQNQTIPTPRTTPVIEDETKDWKTYTDAKFKYNFMYPPNWYLFPTDSGTTYVQSFAPDPNRNPEDMTILLKEAKIDIFWFGTKKFNERLLDYLNRIYREEIEPPTPKSFSEIPLAGGIVAYQPHNGIRYDTIYVDHNDDVFVINLPTQEEHPYRKTVDQILSTFKFLD